MPAGSYLGPNPTLREYSAGEVNELVRQPTHLHKMQTNPAPRSETIGKEGEDVASEGLAGRVRKMD